MVQSFILHLILFVKYFTILNFLNYNLENPDVQFCKFGKAAFWNELISLWCTANVLDAETATISCVTFPVALQMHYVQLLAAANFWYNICNFELQILQLYRLFILKIFAAIFAPYRCILEEEITINLLGSNPWPITPNPCALLSELPGMLNNGVTCNE